jgi:hypothetical protein
MNAIFLTKRAVQRLVGAMPKDEFDLTSVGLNIGRESKAFETP